MQYTASLDNLVHWQPTIYVPAAPFPVGQRVARSSQKDGLPVRCWIIRICRLKAIDARIISVEAA